jgi:hypothetical protein
MVMKQLPHLAPFAALALIAAPVSASEAPVAQRQAAIHFANHGGVDDWRAEDSDTIYFKDNHRRWYRAELFSSAFDLPYANQIGIDASPSGTLDKWGAIYVRGQRYVFRSFEPVDGPPPKRKRHKD